MRGDSAGRKSDERFRRCINDQGVVLLGQSQSRRRLGGARQLKREQPLKQGLGLIPPRRNRTQRCLENDCRPDLRNEHLLGAIERQNMAAQVIRLWRDAMMLAPVRNDVL